MPLSSLSSARVTVTAEWKTKFDQGGLLLILPLHDKPAHAAHKDKRRWIKTGIEFFEGTPNVSTVACDRYADWSLAPLPGASSSGKVTIEISREVADGQKTSTLWVHSVDPVSGDKRPLREIAWVFEEESVEGEKECEIGVYSAKPIHDENDAGNELNVIFENLVFQGW